MTAFLMLGGYVLTIGRNAEGQRGLGHCDDVAPGATLVTRIQDKYIMVCVV